MKRLCLTIALGIAAAAWAEPAPGPKVVATGCIEPAAAAPHTTRADSTRFVLTNTHVAARTAAGAPTLSTVVYRIDDTGDAKVSPYQGQKVELTATLEPQHAPVSGAATVPAPKVNVVSVRELAAKCP